MPEQPGPKLHPHPNKRKPRDLAYQQRTAARPPSGDDPAAVDSSVRYAELHCLSNFSFLRGASHPDELVERAAQLGYEALAITDRNSLAGVVRAHVAAKEVGLHLIIGAEITPSDAPPIVLLCPDRAAYGRLSRLITRGRVRSIKGSCDIRFADIAELAFGLIGIIALPIESIAPAGNSPDIAAIQRYADLFPTGDLFLAAPLAYDTPDAIRMAQFSELSAATGVPLIAANDVHYHAPERRYLQDVLTCIREKCTLAAAGARLFANAERYLRPRDEIARRYQGHEELLERAVSVAARCTFTLDELRYQYPHELVPDGRSASEYLVQLTWSGAAQRYPAGIPPKVRDLVEKELTLIAELSYEHYFLTVWDLTTFARARGILCQGRGSAANSAVCYCLGVTAVDPARIDVLFERFISRERNEPPDIDVDFEHERREEVFQYIYTKYSRERAAITAEVISYRPRSAIRDVGKALGLSLDRVDAIAKAIDWWHGGGIPEESLRGAGVDPNDRTIQMLIRLVKQMLGFPRHLSQHVGGFVITETPLCEIVPLQNGAMPGRTFIEWDKDDIDELGILKVDCLALGMLTAISKASAWLRPADCDPVTWLATVPPEDPAVYEMICHADTLGVFQIESRAQMSMLPRLRPQNFYDLVIEVAIVRPGPIQGGMVHPFLRRRNKEEPVSYPSEAVREVLVKTLGVPLFQEQVMKLAVVAAGFTPGEADQLRRAMAAWRRSGQIEKFQVKLMQGLLANGYTPDFAERLFNQIRGFGEYGFPESHAASFALLVYVSAWLKLYHPAAFAGALINAQPMGFYAPAQIIRDAREHGVTVLPVDVNASGYDCRLENSALRLGLRLIRGLTSEKIAGIESAQREGPIASIRSLAKRNDVARSTLIRLAAADAFRSLGLSRRAALWEILSLDESPGPLFADLVPEELPAPLPPMPLDEAVVQDYDTIGLSLTAHPIELIRPDLAALGVRPASDLKTIADRKRIAVAGLVTHRQRPGTAKGIVFITIEDETGHANLIVRPRVWDRDQHIARTKIAFIAEGVVERQGEVIHLVVNRFRDISESLKPVRVTSRDFH